eukprot:g82868.t1
MCSERFCCQNLKTQSQKMEASETLYSRMGFFFDKGEEEKGTAESCKPVEYQWGIPMINRRTKQYCGHCKKVATGDFNYIQHTDCNRPHFTDLRLPKATLKLSTDRACDFLSQRFLIPPKHLNLFEFPQYYVNMLISLARGYSFKGNMNILLYYYKLLVREEVNGCFVLRTIAARGVRFGDEGEEKKKMKAAGTLCPRAEVFKSKTLATSSKLCTESYCKANLQLRPTICFDAS